MKYSDKKVISFFPKGLRRFASAVAVLVLFMFVGTVTAYALGYNPIHELNIPPPLWYLFHKVVYYFYQAKICNLYIFFQCNLYSLYKSQLFSIAGIANAAITSSEYISDCYAKVATYPGGRVTVSFDITATSTMDISFITVFEQKNCTSQTNICKVQLWFYLHFKSSATI